MSTQPANRTPAPDVPERILVYDGDCSLCVRASKPATWRWLAGRTERRPFSSFEGEEAQRLRDAGVHNELAVIDRASGAIRSGYDGLLWLLEGGLLRWAVPLLRFAPVRWLLRHDYRLVAYNRRIFAPPARTALCACDPDRHVGYRLTFVLVALLWALLFAGLGAALFWTRGALWPDFPLRTAALERAGLAALAVLAAWSAGASVGLALPAERRLDYVGHLAWIWAAMLLPMILAAGLALGGLLVALAGGSGGVPLAPEGWHRLDGVPLGFAAAAWGLALPIALIAGLRRFPRLGFEKRTAVLVALVSWFLPSALLLWWLPPYPWHPS